MNRDSFQRLGTDRQTLSVSQLNSQARLLLEGNFSQIWVSGEVSNLARPASGHVYFTLKDQQAQVRCAFFRQHSLRLRQPLQDGQAITVRARVSLFEGRGDYQLIVESLELSGEGALRQAFEALKQQLTAEGLFATERKRALPSHPQRIGIVSSPSGAVIRDIISVFARRAPQVALTLIPTPVQGRDASAQIVAALKRADAQGFDALIVARGGGSLEDLWCFNEMAVARTLANCRTPTVSAIGHETDVTIADFVADLRAPTPSAAAELLAPDQQVLLEQLSGVAQRLTQQIQQQIKQTKQQVEQYRLRLRHPGAHLREQTQQAAALEMRLVRAWQQHQQKHQYRLQELVNLLNGKLLTPQITQLMQMNMSLHKRLYAALPALHSKQKQQLHALMHRLDMVSPLTTLSRGYSIVRDTQGRVVQDARAIAVGQLLTARLREGHLWVQVQDTPSSQENSSNGMRNKSQK